MPDNIVSIILMVLFTGISALALIRVITKSFAPVKTVKAVVVDKHKVEFFDKYAGNGKHEKYVVVFSINGRKKGFYVSAFSYDGYRLREQGTLKYKGDRVIEFK